MNKDPSMCVKTRNDLSSGLSQNAACQHLAAVILAAQNKPDKRWDDHEIYANSICDPAL